MGNSMRMALGNLCGGEAAKDQQEHADDQKPVQKPKVEKKKQKKNKKGRKSNDNLDEIEEENEPNNIERPVTVGAADIVEEKLEIVRESGSVELKDGGYTSEVDSLDDKQRTLSTASASQSKKIHKIHEVEPIQPESIGIAEADKIFARSAELYEPFVRKNFDFRSAVLEFEHSVDPEKSQPDFEKCWDDYNEMLKRESEGALPPVIEKDESVNDGDEITKPVSRPGPRRTLPAVDICDVSANLQAIRATGRHLLRIIDSTRVQVQSSIKEASDVDIKEHVKGKIVEGEQLGLLSKYAAPGKLRRNLRQLKRALRQLDGVATETKSIMDVIEPLIEEDNTEETVTLKSHTTEEESVIVPVEKAPVVECEIDLFAQLVAELPAAGEHPKIFESEKAFSELEERGADFQSSREEAPASLPKENVEIKVAVDAGLVRKEVPSLIEVLPSSTNDEKPSGASIAEILGAEIAQKVPKPVIARADKLAAASIDREHKSDVGIVEGSANVVVPSSAHALVGTTEVIEITEVHEIIYTIEDDSNQSEREETVRSPQRRHKSEIFVQISQPAANAATETKTLSQPLHVHSEPSISASPSPSLGPKALVNIASKQSGGVSPSEGQPPSPPPASVAVVPTVSFKLPKSDEQDQFGIQVLADIGEEAEEDLPKTVGTVERATPGRSSPCADAEEDDHETMDYGKYVFIDPTASDVQVLRERSRSLDSLVSLQSTRSATSGMSRYGSFEFVTNYEVVIAEKNQNTPTIQET